MDLTGLVSSIYEAASAIDFGRKGFTTRGKIEKIVLEQSASNMISAQAAYWGKQRELLYSIKSQFFIN